MLKEKYLTAISFIIVIYLFSDYLSKIIVGMNIRALIVVLSSLILFFSTLNYKRGMYFLLSYLIIMPFLRRVVYISQARIVNDPILVIPDIMLILMIASYWLFNSNYIMRFINRDKLTKVYTVFILLCILLVFNPLQGGILIGLAGAKLFILPALWFFIGLGLAKEDYRKLLWFLLITGTLTSIYSIYQYLFGFTSFELKWVEEIELSLRIQEYLRPFSVFAGVSDAARYFQLAGGLAFMFMLSSKNPLLSFIMLCLNVTALVLTVSRSAIFAFLFSIGVFLLWRGEDLRKIIIRSTILLLMIFSLYAVIPEEYKEAPGISQRTFVTHLRAGLLNPVKEPSVEVRFSAWRNIPKLLLKAPFGYGIGSITLAAHRYGGFLFYTESSYFGIWGATGILGGLIFTYLLYLMFKYLIELYSRSDDREFFRIVIGFVSGMFASIIIAELFNFYAVAPFFWLTLGWIVREHREMKNVINNNSEL